METVHVYPSPTRHKWVARVPSARGARTVRFGARGYEDYTMHKDASRMRLYLARHMARERWDWGGRYTAGFWSRWLLWSAPSLRAAVRRMQREFAVRIMIHDS